MGSTSTILGGGRGTDLSSAASAQPGSAATALFPYLEADLPARLGVAADKIAAARKGMDQGVHWYRINRAFHWSKEGVAKLASEHCGAKVASDVKTAPGPVPDVKTAPAANGGPVVLTVANLNIPNRRLVLCRDAAGKAVTVFINPAWRSRFRHGMKIEATEGAGGRWHTRCPRFVGKF